MHPINRFPEFTPFSAQIKPVYDDIYRQYPPYADFSFGNLAIWLNQLHDLQLSLHNGNIIIECSNLFDNGQLVTSVLGSKKVDQTIDMTFDYLAVANRPLTLRMVPETTVLHLSDAKKYTIREERDNFNYLLSTRQLSALEGSSFGRLRRQIRGFESAYEGRFELEALDLSDHTSVRKLINHMHLWERIYTDNDRDKQESFAIAATLKYAKKLGFHNLSLNIDGQIQAFALYQSVPQAGYVIGNHTKANEGYKNAFNFLVHRLARQLYSEGIGHINFEQDMGIAGLREHKLGLRPVSFLKHYSIEPESGNE